MTEKLRTYCETGEYLANGWGRGDAGDWDAQMENSEKTVCLLAAVLKELQHIRTVLLYVKPDDPPSISGRVINGPAHGRFRALQITLGRVRIDELDSTPLDGRVWHVIRRSGLVWLDEITPERLKSVKGCGPKAIATLMAWKSEWLSKKTSETEKQPKT